MSTTSNRLGMILKGYPRISETFISNEIRLMESLGFEIDIISMRKPREDFTHDSVKEIKAPVHYLPSRIGPSMGMLIGNACRVALDNPKGFMKGAKMLASRFARSRKAATIKHFLQACHITDKVLKGSGITHLHAHFAHSPTSVAYFTSTISGIPFSFTAHAKDIWTQNPDSIRDKIAAACFVATCTKYNKKYLQSLNETGTPLHCVYHGIDLRLFNGELKKRNAAEPLRIFTIARFTTKKGLPTIIKALKRLKDRDVPFEYCLIGDGDDRAQTMQLIEEYGLKSHVDWLGTKPHGEVLKQFAMADMFVLGCEIAPNGDRDGIPNVLAESMAMRVPVISTTVSGIPELVENEVSGLLVEPGDHEAMADAMERLASDESFRISLTEAAHKRVHEIFDNQPLIRELAEVYRSHGLGPQ